jgi:hypothetical protein
MQAKQLAGRQINAEMFSDILMNFSFSDCYNGRAMVGLVGQWTLHLTPNRHIIFRK